jgi:RNA polymerase sigma factor (sigma-70 family)
VWSLSDEALLAGLATGDEAAATAFVRRHQARVYGLALTIVGDRSAAEEIAQEAFLRAWRHAGVYDPRRGRAATWLLAITRNLAIDRIRMRRPEPIDPATVRDRERALWASAGADDPGDALAGTVVALREELGRLPEEQRRALLLAALFGYTASEIASIEGAAVGTAKTRIRTALIKVNAALEPDAGGRSEPGR